MAIKHTVRQNKTITITLPFEHVEKLISALMLGNNAAQDRPYCEVSGFIPLYESMVETLERAKRAAAYRNWVTGSSANKLPVEVRNPERVGYKDINKNTGLPR